MIKGGDEVRFIATEKQLRILQLVQQHPDWTQEMIAKELGITQSVVSYHLKQLIKNNPDKHDIVETIRAFDARTSYRFYTFRPRF